MSQTEREQDSYETSGTSPPQASAAAAKPKNYVAEGFRNKTKGEGWFNFLTYGVLGYVGVTAFSIFMTWMLRDSGTFISRGYNNGVEGFSNFLRKQLPNANWLHNFVDSNASIATLFAGGTLVSVLPIKWLEDSKPQIIKGFDEHIYGKDAVANDPKLVAAHRELDEVPKQTWKSVGMSRVLAFAATYGTSFLIGSHNTPGAKATGTSIDELSIKVGRGADKLIFGRKNDAVAKHIDTMKTQHADNALGVIREKEIAGRPGGPWLADRIPSRVFSYVTLDAIYTAITSSALFVFTRMLAPVFDKHDHEKNPHPTHAPAPASTAPVAPAEKTAPAPARETPKTAVAQVSARDRIAEPQRETALA